jgi:dolichol-phosphate mannosyltransferase
MAPPPFEPPDLTVVVPTLNERDNVLELARRLDSVLAGIAWELIVVDDDSADGTAQAVKALSRQDPRVRCIRRVKRRGLAGACIEGVLASAAPVVAIMDADLQHDETLLPRMFEPIRSGEADLVVASRNAAGGSRDTGFSPLRRAISGTGEWLSRFGLGARLSDPMSGFFMIRRELVEEIAPRLATSGFKILVDIVATLPRPPRILELPYTFRPRLAGESKLGAEVLLDYAGLILHKWTKGLLPLRFIKFVLVGASGVIVHLAVLRLTLAVAPAQGFAFGQTVATLAAMTSNFALNNILTYRDLRLTGSAFFAGLMRFYLVCGIGAVANVGVASWVFEARPVWWLAGLAGACVGAVWNYAAASTLVWRRGG